MCAIRRSLVFTEDSALCSLLMADGRLSVRCGAYRRGPPPRERRSRRIRDRDFRRSKTGDQHSMKTASTGSNYPRVSGRFRPNCFSFEKQTKPLIQSSAASSLQWDLEVSPGSSGSFRSARTSTARFSTANLEAVQGIDAITQTPDIQPPDEKRRRRIVPGGGEHEPGSAKSWK